MTSTLMNLNGGTMDISNSNIYIQNSSLVITQKYDISGEKFEISGNMFTISTSSIGLKNIFSYGSGSSSSSGQSSILGSNNTWTGTNTFNANMDINNTNTNIKSLGILNISGGQVNISGPLTVLHKSQINGDISLNAGVSINGASLTIPNIASMSNSDNVVVYDSVNNRIKYEPSGNIISASNNRQLTSNNAWTGKNQFNSDVSLNAITSLTSDVYATALASTPSDTNCVSFNTGTKKLGYTAIPALLPSNNAWTGKNQFNGDVSLNAITSLTSDVYATALASTPSDTNCVSFNTGTKKLGYTAIPALLPSNNAWTGTNTFTSDVSLNSNVYAGALASTPSDTNCVSFNTGTKKLGYTAIPALLPSNNTWTGTNTFNSNVSLNNTTTQINSTSVVGLSGGIVNISGGAINIGGGNTIINGNVGIGTQSPECALDVSGIIRAKNPGNNGAVSMVAGTNLFPGYVAFYKPNGTRVGYIGWEDSTANYFQLMAENPYLGYKVKQNLLVDGNVGIGTTSPAYKLDVNGESIFRSNMYFADTTFGLYKAYPNVLRIGHINTANAYLDFDTTGNSALYGNGVFTLNPTKIAVGAGSNIYLNDRTMYLRSDNNHYLNYNSTYDGPRLAGYLGGEMGYTNGGYTKVIGYNSAGLEVIGTGGKQNTHGTVKGLYVCAEFGDTYGGAEFRHSNGTQGVGIAYAGIYACGSNPTQSLTIKSKGNDYIKFNTNNTNRMTITGGGNVGIGTENPDYPLRVSGSESYTAPTYSITKYFDSGSTNIQTQLTTGYSYSYSIYADAGIVCNGKFSASSDKRIKTNIVDIDDEKALQTLRLIKPKTYDYIDKLDRGSANVIGFIAQEIKEIIPKAVSIIKDYVPNFYTICKVSATDASNIVLVASQIDLSWNPLHDQSGNAFVDVDGNACSDASGNKVFNVKLYDQNNNEIRCKTTDILDKRSFLMDITGTTLLDASGNVVLEKDGGYFLHGQEVDDFHTLDKNAIFTVVTAAVQDIDRIVQASLTQVQAQAGQIQAQAGQIQAQNVQIQAQNAQIQALESKNAALESLVATQQTQLAEQQSQIATQQTQLAEQQSLITQQQSQIAAQQAQINAILARLGM